MDIESVFVQLKDIKALAFELAQFVALLAKKVGLNLLQIAHNNVQLVVVGGRSLPQQQASHTVSTAMDTIQHHCPGGLMQSRVPTSTRPVNRNTRQVGPKEARWRPPCCVCVSDQQVCVCVSNASCEEASRSNNEYGAGDGRLFEEGH